MRTPLLNTRRSFSFKFSANLRKRSTGTAERSVSCIWCFTAAVDHGFFGIGSCSPACRPQEMQPGPAHPRVGKYAPQNAQRRNIGSDKPSPPGQSHRPSGKANAPARAKPLARVPTLRARRRHRKNASKSKIKERIPCI